MADKNWETQTVEVLQFFRAAPWPIAKMAGVLVKHELKERAVAGEEPRKPRGPKKARQVLGRGVGQVKAGGEEKGEGHG